MEKLVLTEEELRKILTSEEYAVLRQKATEKPFSGKLLYEDRDGMYLCKVCGNKLFSSDAKFDSGTGWPSFDQALPESVIEVPDDSLGTHRIEVTCSRCGSHLGHLFPDGPTKTGKRYCLNSVCLDLEENK